MGPRPGTRPPGPLPSLHTLQLRRPIELHDAVDLAVGMRVVLTRVYVFAVHVHGRDAEEVVLRRGKRDLAAAVSVAVELGFGDPAFLETLEDVLAKVFVVWATRAVFGIQTLFHIFAGCPARPVNFYTAVKKALRSLTDPPSRQETPHNER